MTVQASTAQSVANAHAALRARTDIQFEMAAATPPQPPAWMRWLGQEMVRLAPIAPTLFWICVAIGAAIILYLIVTAIRRWLPSRDVEVSEAEPDVAAWRPSERAARALLADAEALAGQGRFEEAVHLLLHRSLEDIQRNRPRLLRPALTSREIAGADWMPGIVRRAFAAMAAPVERSLFGGRSLARTDWEEARAAYGEFALPGAWK